VRAPHRAPRTYIPLVAPRQCCNRTAPPLERVLPARPPRPLPFAEITSPTATSASSIYYALRAVHGGDCNSGLDAALSFVIIGLIFRGAPPATPTPRNETVNFPRGGRARRFSRCMPFNELVLVLCGNGNNAQLRDHRSRRPPSGVLSSRHTLNPVDFFWEPRCGRNPLGHHRLDRLPFRSFLSGNQHRRIKEAAAPEHPAQAGRRPVVSPNTAFWPCSRSGFVLEILQLASPDWRNTIPLGE